MIRHAMLIRPTVVRTLGSRSMLFRMGQIPNTTLLQSGTNTVPAVYRPSTLRCFSSNTKKEAKEDDAEAKELVLTPGEKVVVAGRLGLWLGVGAFAAVCAYYIGKELIPT